VGERTARAGRTAIWVLLGGSVAAALLFVGAKATLPSDGGRIAFYDDAWSTAGVVIAPLDSPQPGLEAGDRVEVIAGRPMDAWAALVLDPGAARPAGGPLGYQVTRDDAQVETAVTWAPPALGSTLLEAWSVALFSIAIALVAAFVYARRPDAPAAVPLMLVAAGAAGSSVPWLIGTTTSDLVQGGPFLYHTILTAGLYMLMWPAAVHLGLVFPQPRRAVARRPSLVAVPYLVALGAYAVLLVLGWATSPSLLDWIGTWPRTQLAIVVPCVVVALGLMILTYRGAADPDARIRARWAALGAGASILLGLVLFQLPELLLDHPLVPASAIGLVALPLPLGVAAGILRDRLFGIDVVVNRTLVYGGLSLVVVATYVVVAAVLGSIAGPEQGYGVSLVSTGAAALLALPLRDRLQRAVDRLMYGERDEPWRAMRRLGQRLELAGEPDRTFPAIVETVADSLRLPYVALLVTDEHGELSTVRERGTRPASTLAIPLIHGAEEVGRLELGTRPGERRFRPDEERLLEDLGRQAGGAIRALRLRDALVRSRERLVLAREEERRRLRRDLHDGLGPSLAAIGLRAEAATALLADDPAAARRLLDELSADVTTAVADVRRLVDGLRPPALDEVGLVAAIEQQARRLEGGQGQEGPRISVDGSPSPLPELPAAVEVAAYRIAVEGMTNVVRHASARTCRVRITAVDGLEIVVTDDGHGQPTALVPGTGLESMVARAEELGGEVGFQPEPGGGTRLVARLPLAGSDRGSAAGRSRAAGATDAAGATEAAATSEAAGARMTMQP
jgi:signal transduction histidine kinase